MLEEQETAASYERQESSVEDQAIESALQDQILHLLAKIPPRERRVLELRFGFHGETLTYDQIAADLSVSRERARQLECQALARLCSMAEAYLGVWRGADGRLYWKRDRRLRERLFEEERERTTRPD